MTEAPEGTLLTRQPISILFDRLRGEGFLIGIDQYANAQALVTDMLQADAIRDVTHLQNILSAFAVKSPDQRDRFRAHFDFWLTFDPAQDIDSPEGDPRNDLPILETKSHARNLTIAGLVLIFLAALAVFNFADISAWINTAQPAADAPTPQGGELPGPAKTDTEVVAPSPFTAYGLLGGGILILIALGFFWSLRGMRSLQFIRRHSVEGAILQDVAVRNLSKRIAPAISFRKVSQALGQYEKSGLSLLDPTKTAEASARTGIPTPVFADLLQKPDFLVLIDVASQDDHLLELANSYCELLVENGLILRRFHFRGNPTKVTGSGGRLHRLVNLLTERSGLRLIVFSDGIGFGSGPGLPTWVRAASNVTHKALMTTRPKAAWRDNEEMLQAAGFFVGNASVDGLRAFAITLNESESRTMEESATGLRTYPTILTDRAYRWLDDVPPSDDQIGTLLAQLRSYLGLSGYQWLCMTAVFPTLALPITLHLKQTASGQMGDLPALAGLPWFKQGRIPDWMRLRLIEELSDDATQATRKTLQTLFVEPTDNLNSNSTLEIAQSASRGWFGSAKRWFQRPIANSATREYIFLEFMAGRKITTLSTSAPAHIKALLRERAHSKPTLPEVKERKPNSFKPLPNITIETAYTGFYRGFNSKVTVASKVIIGFLVLWSVLLPTEASAILGNWNTAILSQFAAWYIWVVTAFLLVCIGLAIWPATGRLNLGAPGEKPEFSNFSWFSMMFGAGIGVGMLVWAVAEPIAHFQNNPVVIQGVTTAQSADNVRSAYVWSFMHWGLRAWACFSIVGLSIAFFTYRHQLPLTLRSCLTPLFGKSLSGNLGHAIDILAVVVTVMAIIQTLGFGAEQFAVGLSRIGIGGLVTVDGDMSVLGIFVALAILMGLSTVSALSGVGKGIKRLSNVNMILSLFLLGFLFIFGATFFGATAFFVGIWDYLIELPWLSVNVYRSDGVEGSEAFLLAQWQGWWPVFYWAWWIAFAPVVGLFMARVSRGRTIREFVLGSMLVPTLMCFAWLSWSGGTAIDLELNGGANGVIRDAANGDKFFAMIEYMLGPISDVLSWGMAVVIVVLLMTFLVTSTDSAILVVNTINGAGEEGPKTRPHVLFWGAALAVAVGFLWISGGTSAIQTAMVIGSLPISAVILLISFALVQGIVLDARESDTGLETTGLDSDLSVEK